MKTITFLVKDEIAEIVSQYDEEKINSLTAQIEDLVKNKSDLMKSIKQLQREAKKNGLTPEILADILEIDQDEMDRIMGIQE